MIINELERRRLEFKIMTVKEGIKRKLQKVNYDKTKLDSLNEAQIGVLSARKKLYQVRLDMLLNEKKALNFFWEDTAQELS